jgi:hypothetical protein
MSCLYTVPYEVEIFVTFRRESGLGADSCGFSMHRYPAREVDHSGWHQELHPASTTVLSTRASLKEQEV